ncbi:unnamed protein product [Urochloa decumbens]|uniref:DUF7597 domain-containing protein n=1 Tax=Urochloa decumbens TaxID=240449 RepID=A0ABC9EXI6_9POAL
MAYRFVNPAPFMPRGTNRLMVGNRKPMTRVVLGGATRNNCDVAIAIIEPIPLQQVSFQSISAVLDDFIRNEKRTAYRSIQRCPYGQAYVRFNSVIDRDILIHASPHVYGNYNISFIEHNRAWNNRTTTMNCDVWLMLLGYNIDFWSKVNLEKTVAEFGKLLVWEEDPYNLARVVVKVRVVVLSEVPWFIFCSEGEDIEGDSWTTQCEILQYRLLGGGPGDEEQPPDFVEPNLFDFFGYGQPNVQHHQHHQPQNQNNAGGNLNQDNGAAQWGLWPEQQINDAFIGPQPAVNHHLQAAAQNQGNNQDQAELMQPAQMNETPPQAPLDHLVMVDLAFDLNMAPADDLGEVDMEDIIPVVADNMEAENIIDGTDSSENTEPAQVPQGFGDNMEVEVFIPLENGQPMHFIPEDIQIEDLLNDAENMVNEGQGQGEHIHLGFVEVPEFNYAPLFESRMAAKRPALFQGNPTMIRHWANYFCPRQGNHKVEIPLFWADFFTAQLLNPLNFNWAKDFLSTPAASLLDVCNGHVSFSVPAKCPRSEPPRCTKLTQSTATPSDKGKGQVSEGLPLDQIASTSSAIFNTSLQPISSPITPSEDTLHKVTTTPGPWSKKLLDKAGKANAFGTGTYLSEEELRRSKRKNVQKHGFKNSPCSNETCIGCSVKLPAIPPSVIKNLGATFCKIDPEKLSTEVLNTKKKAAAPGGKKLLKKKPNKVNDDADNSKIIKKKPKKQ